MTDLPVPTPKTTTYRGAISHVEQIQWERLNEITVADAIFKWLAVCRTWVDNFRFVSASGAKFWRIIFEPEST